MNHISRRLLASFYVIAAACLVGLGSVGCSRKGNVAAHLAKAKSYHAAGDYEKAEIEYKNALQAQALNPEAIGQLGLIYLEEGRIRQSVPYLLKARELKPDNLEVRRKLGSLYVMFGKAKEAREEATYVLDHQPTDAAAPLLLLEASMATPEDIKAAREKLQNLPGGAAGGAPVLVALGLSELRQRNFPAAEASFNRAVTADPKFAAAYSALAVVYRNQKDLAKTEQALKTAAELAPLRSGKIIQYAQFKVQKGDREGGRLMLEDLTKKAPDYLPAHAVLAEMAAAEKKYDESAAIVARILGRDPENPEAMLLNGRLKLAKGQPDKAVVDLEKMLKVYPNSPQALYFLGIAYAGTGDQQKAIDRLTQAVNLSPAPEAVLALAGLNLRKGDYSAVILGLKPLVQQRPDNGQARMLLAQAYQAQGNYSDALALYRQAEKDFPRNAQASLMSGLALLQQKKFDEARTAFEEALTRTPGYLPALEQLVYLDLANKRFDPVMKRLEAELARSPKVAALHVLLAKAYMVQSDTSHAEAEFEKAIELQPDLTEAYYQLARLYIGTNQQEKALASLEAAIAKNPKDLKSLLLIGLIQDNQKNYPAAREAYEKILALNPKFSPVLNNLAYLYSEHFNELDKAYDAAQKARELLPNEPHVADTLGWILYKKGLYSRALSLLEESADQLPSEAEVRYHLGVTQYMLGQEQPAKVSLQRALELNRELPWADDARKRLAVLSVDPSTAAGNAVGDLEKALAAQPGDPIVLGRLAAAYERSGAIDKAVAAYQSMAKANPTNVAPLVSIARLYASQKDAAKAMEAARSARKVAPDDVDVAKVLGALAYEMHDYSWAANLLQDAARRQPDDPELLYDAAKALYSVGKVSEAEVLVRDALNPPGPAKLPSLALNVTPSAPDPLVTSTAKPAFGRADEAREFLALLNFAATPSATPAPEIEQALKKSPDSVPALMALGASQELKPDASAARSTYEKVLTQFPDFSPAKLRLAVLGAGAAEFDQKAYDLAMQARTAFPSNPDAAKALGILTYRKGDDYPRAVTLLKQSVSARSTDAETQYYLGLAQIQTKDNAGARQSLQKAIDAGLRADLAADAKKKLEGIKS